MVIAFISACHYHRAGNIMGTLKAGTCGVAVLQGGYRLWTAGVAARSRVQSNGDMKTISFILVVRVFQFVLELLPNLLATTLQFSIRPYGNLLTRNTFGFVVLLCLVLILIVL